MSTTLLVCVTVAYALVALDFYIKGDAAMSWVFAGYVAANGGFIYQATNHG